MNRRILLTGILASLLTGCAVTPIPIDNLTYRGKVTTQSDKVARLSIGSTGIGGVTSTTLMPAGGIFIPIENRSSAVPFGTKDQQEFLQSFQKELVRLGVVKRASLSGLESADLDVGITIDNARFSVDQVEFTIDMTMTLAGMGLPSTQRKYRVTSTEKDKGLDGWTTNGAQAREKLAHLMLERLIPDVEAFLAAVPRK